VTLRSAQLWLTLCVAILSPLPFGSVDIFWITTWTLLLAVGGLLSVAVVLTKNQAWILLTFLAVCSVYAAVALFQIMPNPPASLGNPIWSTAQKLLETELSPRISVRGTIPIASITHFILFVMAFINGFLVGTSRTRSATLFFVISISLSIYAVYGLASYFFTPGTLLWVNKLAYRGSLTGTFVNHNTAATYFGTGCILWLCYVFAHIRSLQFVSVRLFLFADMNEEFILTLVLRLLGLLVCLSALVETGSRGGILCTAVGIVTSTVLAFIDRWRGRRWMLLGCIASIPLIAFFAVSNSGRIGSQGIFDAGRAEVYQSVYMAVLATPLFGQGAGTFQDVFPALRTDGMYIWGVWEQAHSTILEIALEMGLPVASLVIFCAIGSVIILARGAIGETGSTKLLLAGATGIATIGFLHSVIDFSLQVPGYSTIFAILLGCGMARATTTRDHHTSRGNRAHSSPACS
jgi:O-antigen ligase